PAPRLAPRLRRCAGGRPHPNRTGGRSITGSPGPPSRRGTLESGSRCAQRGDDAMSPQRSGGCAMPGEDGNPARWQDELYDLLRRHNVIQFAYVPDAGHRILIDRSLADPGVALLAGADLGGARGVLLMQSSGTGNCINMLSLIKGGHFPFLTLVSMRGDFGEGNPWQYPMGQAVEPVLQAMGVICLRIEQPE